MEETETEERGTRLIPPSLPSLSLHPKGAAASDSEMLSDLIFKGAARREREQSGGKGIGVGLFRFAKMIKYTGVVCMHSKYSKYIRSYGSPFTSS